MATLKDIGIVLLALGVLALVLGLWAWSTFKHLNGLYRLLTGQVPRYRVVRLVVLVVFVAAGLAIAVPTFEHYEHKSPLHLVAKPAAEARVRSNADAQALVGQPMVFGNEEGWSYSSESGDMTFPVTGSKAKANVYVTAKAVAGVWQPTSIDLKMGDRSISIPVQ